MVPGGYLMVPRGYLMVPGGYLMVPGGYLNKGVLLSCSGQQKSNTTKRRNHNLQDTANAKVEYQIGVICRFRIFLQLNSERAPH